jgi:transcriptional regulator with XRE-family HTH domain
MPAPTCVRPGFAEWLIRARRKRALSQEELAQRMGVGVRTIGAWESGEHRPSCRSLRLIAAATGTPISELHVLDPPVGPDRLAA